MDEINLLKNLDNLDFTKLNKITLLKKTMRKLSLIALFISIWPGLFVFFMKVDFHDQFSYYFWSIGGLFMIAVMYLLTKPGLTAYWLERHEKDNPVMDNFFAAMDYIQELERGSGFIWHYADYFNGQCPLPPRRVHRILRASQLRQDIVDYRLYYEMILYLLEIKNYKTSYDS